MPPDWLGRFVLAWSAADAIGLLLWLWCVVISVYSDVQQEPCEQCEARRTHRQPTDRDRPSTNMTNPPTDDPRPEAERERREEQHWRVEERYWYREILLAWAMVSFTAVASVVGAVGLYILWGTLNATADQVETARIAQRAWLLIDHFTEPHLPPNTPIPIDFSFRNMGESPALYVYVMTTYLITDAEELPPDPPYPTPHPSNAPPRTNRSTSTVGPNQDRGMTVTIAPQTYDTMQAIRAGTKKSLFVYGFARYWDVFGLERGLIFCGRYREHEAPPEVGNATGRFQSCRTYNDVW